MPEQTRILIVEDEFIVRKGIMETIDWKAINCEIIGEASDGKEAIKEIRRLKPDIIITDVCMKEMDGIELIKWIKDEEADTKAIILSGYNDFEYAKSAMELGVRYYLLKPIENKKLIEAITSVQAEIDKEKKKQTPVTRQQIALRKLLEKGNADELLENMGLVVPASTFVVANIKIESDYDDKGSETLKFTTELLESIDYFTGIDIHYSLSILVGEGNVAMIIFENSGKMAEKSILKNIRTHFASKTGKRLSIGVSCVGSSINDIHELYEQSCLALRVEATIQIILFTTKTYVCLRERRK